MPAIQPKFDVAGAKFGAVKLNVKARNHLIDLSIVKIITIVEFRVVIGVLADNRAKGIDVSDMKSRLRNGTPQQFPIKRFKDEVIGTYSGGHSTRPI